MGWIHKHPFRSYDRQGRSFTARHSLLKVGSTTSLPYLTTEILERFTSFYHCVVVNIVVAIRYRVVWPTSMKFK